MNAAWKTRITERYAINSIGPPVLTHSVFLFLASSKGIRSPFAPPCPNIPEYVRGISLESSRRRTGGGEGDGGLDDEEGGDRLPERIVWRNGDRIPAHVVVMLLLDSLVECRLKGCSLDRNRRLVDPFVVVVSPLWLVRCG